MPSVERVERLDFLHRAAATRASPPPPDEPPEDFADLWRDLGGGD